MPPIYKVSVTYTDEHNEQQVLRDATMHREYAYAHLVRHSLLQPNDITKILNLIEGFGIRAYSNHGERLIEVEYLPEGDVCRS